MITPLVDVDDSNGATMFVCGSHTSPVLRQAKAGVTLPVRRSSVLFFDIRLLHRGGANRGVLPRPLLYMSYVKEWFRDGVNFRGRQCHDNGR